MVSLDKLRGRRHGHRIIAPGSNILLEHAAPALGVVRLHGEQIELVAPRRADFQKTLPLAADRRLAGTVSFDPDGTSPVFVEGSVNFVLRHKFGYFLVGRDTHAAALLGFHGLRWYCTRMAGIASWPAGSRGRSRACYAWPTYLGR